MKPYSVLMSVYAKEQPQFLKLAIESILNQTVSADEFIIVCDGPLTFDLNYILDLYNYTLLNMKRRFRTGGGSGRKEAS